MSIQKRKRELLRMARELCADAIIEQSGGSHLRITFIGPAGISRVICAMTPSDHRDVKNVKRNFKQAAREVGVLPVRILPQSKASVVSV